jgi:putative transposase
VPGARRLPQLFSRLAARGAAAGPSTPPGVKTLPVRSAVLEASKRRYGAPRIHAELQGRGRGVSKRTVAKLMKGSGIRPPRGRRRVPITTDSRHAHAVAPNLLDRNFEDHVPDTVWLANTSYITTGEGWLTWPR